MLATKNDSFFFFFFVMCLFFYQFSFTMSKKIKNLFAKKLVGSCFKARILMMLAPCSLNGLLLVVKDPMLILKNQNNVFRINLSLLDKFLNFNIQVC